MAKRAKSKVVTYDGMYQQVLDASVRRLHKTGREISSKEVKEELLLIRDAGTPKFDTQFQDDMDYDIFSAAEDMNAKRFVTHIQRWCVDEGQEFTNLLVELLKMHDARAAIDVPEGKRRVFLGELELAWSRYNDSFGSKGG